MQNKSDQNLISSLLQNPLFKLSDDYITRYNAAAASIVAGKYKSDLEHFAKEIEKEKLSPNILFDAKWYEYEAAIRSKRQVNNAVLDYVNFAGREQLSPHWLFDEGAVQHQLPSLSDAVIKGNIISAYYAYVAMDLPCLDDVVPHWLFSPSYFRYKNGPSRRPLLDFIKKTQTTEADCSAFFDSNYYKSIAVQSINYINPDGYRSTPLEHFIKIGHSAGLIPIPDFDQEYYLTEYPDIASAINAGHISSAYEHFVKHGHKEFRNPNKYFSSHEYLNINPSVHKSIAEKEFLSPFEHFIAVGYKAGLPARQPLSKMAQTEISGKSLFEKKSEVRAQAYRRKHQRWESTAEVEVSFVIPAHNNYNFTASLLHQINEAYTLEGGRFEVILVDNGSTDETCQMGSSGNLVVVRNSEQLGYTKACNEGARFSRGKRLVFLNNDIEIEPGIIREVLKISPTPHNTIIGPKIIATTGVLQEAGSYVLSDGSCVGYGRGKDPNDIAFSYPRKVDYVSGCFLIISKEFFTELGFFDEAFSPGYYEDTDLCLRAIQAGGTVMYDPNLYIYHYEYASYSKGRPPAISMGLMERNKRAFIQKHRDFLSMRHKDDVYPTVLEKSYRTARRVLIVEDDVPQYNHGSGFSRTADVIEAFLSSGVSVSVWPIHNNGILPRAQWRNNASLSYIDVRSWSGDFQRYLFHEGWSYSVVWICRTHNIRALAIQAEKWRRTDATHRLVLDTEAIDTMRKVSLISLLKKSVSQDIVAQSIAQELGNTLFADHIVAVNDIDAAAIKDAIGINPLIVGHSFEAQEPTNTLNDRKDIGFLGALYARDTPNFDSLVWFDERVRPHLKNVDPTIKTLVAGHSRLDMTKEAIFQDGRLTYVGEVQDLKPFFSRLRVLIAPTRYAGGIPHKVQNALAHGLPVVLTELLANQLGLTSKNYPDVLISPVSEPERFARGIFEIYKNDELWAEASNAGLDYIKSACNKDLFRASVLSVMHGRA